MTEKQNIEFYRLLEMFIEDCGLDRIEECRAAQKLLEALNQ